MEDFETLNDAVDSIKTNVDEIGTKVAKNANALVQVNITITNFLSKDIFSMPYLWISLQIRGLSKKRSSCFV